MGDSGVRRDLREKVSGWFIAATSRKQSGPGENSGADRNSGSIPESGGSGGDGDASGRKGPRVHRQNRSHKYHDNSSIVWKV
jgi:hypothetical protein